MIKRMFDLVASGFGLVLVGPLLLGVAAWIKLDSRGAVFFRQVRVGRGGQPFRIFKFRTMVVDAERKGMQITVGDRDPRVTRAGYHLRRLKMDELPQLINVFLGDMSFVGPRPEVPRYVELYSTRQRGVLSVRPGITDPASIAFRDENELLAKESDPERAYIETIMPKKLEMNLEYQKRATFASDLLLIWRTVSKIVVS
ncbi:MAG: sugar transferase [Fibrobacteres bacterium]|nr:sugar transferase [Fibrobacterota bacterium]